MEMNRDSVVSVVKAARTAGALAEKLQNIMAAGKAETEADLIFGFLTDALYIMSGGNYTESGDISESTTFRLLKSNYSDGDVADELLRMSEVRMPAPVFVSEEEKDELFRRNGGYRHQHDDEMLAKAKTVLRDCEDENVRMRRLLGESCIEMCKLCNARKLKGVCDGCKWKRVRNGDFS